MKTASFLLQRLTNSIPAAACLVSLSFLVLVEKAEAQLGLGDTIGIDFASPAAVFPEPPPATSPPAAGTNFNAFDIQTDEDAVGVDENGDPDATDVLDQSASLAAGTLIRILDGATVSGVGFSVTNNTGKASGLTGIAGSGGPGLFNDATIYADNYGAANVGMLTRADGGVLLEDANFVFTFSGLDDSLGYDVSGGYLHETPNDNFNTTWEADGQSAETFNTSELADAGYTTLTGLSTDGSGNLDITVSDAAVQLFIAGLTLTATEGAAFDPGDHDMDGDVDGADFLEWQRNDGTPGGLDDWQQDYPTGAPVSEFTAVPEPSALVLVALFAGASATVLRRRIA